MSTSQKDFSGSSWSWSLSDPVMYQTVQTSLPGILPDLPEQPYLHVAVSPLGQTALREGACLSWLWRPTMARPTQDFSFAQDRSG